VAQGIEIPQQQNVLHPIIVSQNGLFVLELKKSIFIIGNGFLMNLAYYFIIFDLYFSQQ
jgi:hypothetical protein